MLFDFLDGGQPTESLMREAARAGITLFGAGGFARAVASAVRARGIRVVTFVVSGPSGGSIDDLPIVSLGDLEPCQRDLPMWIAVFNRDHTADFRRIAASCRAAGIERVRLPQVYFGAIEQFMGWRYWLADSRRYAEKRVEIEEAFNMLADDESRAGFLETLGFRVGASGDHSPQPCCAEQYFPPQVVAFLAEANQPITYVDGGAYDGDTLQAAAEHLDLGAAFVFEPDPGNFERLTAKARAFDFPVTCVPCGLSDRLEWQAFACESGEASAVTPNGESYIQCVSLDICMLSQRIDYIKLDIEGHEIAALEGSKNIIQRDRPVLAIAAYHRWDDLWNIPALLRRMDPDRRLSYLTHESNTFDSVFYAIR